MPIDASRKVIEGACPNCGPSRIRVVLEGSAHFNQITNSSCGHWVGICSKCHAYLESYFEDDQDAGELEWELADEEEVEFLFGDSPPTL